MDKLSILDLQVKHIKNHPNIFEDQESEKRRAAIMMELIYLRCIAREDIRDYIEISERLRQCRRDHVKLREQGV